MRRLNVSDGQSIAMHLLAAVAVNIIGWSLIFWFGRPAINIQSVFPFIVAIMSAVTGLVFFIENSDFARFISKFFLVIAVIVIVMMIVGAIASSTLFNAVSYSSVVQVEEGTKDDIPSSTDMKRLFLTDTKSAKKLCDRVLGSQSDYASQYDVGGLTQIVYKGESVKVAPLAYADFFKWNANRQNGVPAYVIVRNDAEGKPYAQLVKLDKGMRYVPSAAMNEKLSRRLYDLYPSYMKRKSHFEIDEDGKPYYITPYITHTIGAYGGKKIEGVLITDPVTGDVSDYKLKDIPSWVDLAVDGDLISEQYNWYGTLRNGYWNSVIGQKGCVHTTDDYGYVSDGTDIWVFTGVTSVTGDSSNLGFILGNERTGEIKYMACDGADEKSAMGAAEGEVQEKGYTASFPSLITIDGEPTYVMVLKDKNSLTKAYVCVNVARYDQVAVASDPESCFESYKKLIKGEISQTEAVSDSEDSNNKGIVAIDTDKGGYTVKRDIMIKRIVNVDIDGNTYVYIEGSDSNIYRAKFSDVIDLIRYDAGDKVTIYTTEGAVDGIYDFSLNKSE